MEQAGGGPPRYWELRLCGGQMKLKKYKKSAAILLLSLSNSDELANVTTEERRGVL